MFLSVSLITFVFPKRRGRAVETLTTQKSNKFSYRIYTNIVGEMGSLRSTIYVRKGKSDSVPPPQFMFHKVLSMSVITFLKEFRKIFMTRIIAILLTFLEENFLYTFVQSGIWWQQMQYGDPNNKIVKSISLSTLCVRLRANCYVFTNLNFIRSTFHTIFIHTFFQLYY